MQYDDFLDLQEEGKAVKVRVSSLIFITSVYTKEHESIPRANDHFKIINKEIKEEEIEPELAKEESTHADYLQECDSDIIEEAKTEPARTKEESSYFDDLVRTNGIIKAIIKQNNDQKFALIDDIIENGGIKNNCAKTRFCLN